MHTKDFQTLQSESKQHGGLVSQDGQRKRLQGQRPCRLAVWTDKDLKRVLVAVGRPERHFGGISHFLKRLEELALFMKIKNNVLNDETHYDGWTKTKTPKKREDVFISLHRGLKLFTLDIL